MAEYIERSAAIRALTLHDCDSAGAKIVIRDIHAADVAPVVYSRFVNMGGFPACENCGASPGTVEPKPDNPSGFPPYCFACGAKMDKEACNGLEDS